MVPTATRGSCDALPAAAVEALADVVATAWRRPRPRWDDVLAMISDRDRDAQGRARQTRPRDKLGRPLPYGSAGVEPVSEDPLPPSETISYDHELMDQGRPFAAHEVYEARWKSGPSRPIRTRQPPRKRGGAMSTRTIAIAALVIAVILLIIFLA